MKHYSGQNGLESSAEGSLLIVDDKPENIRVVVNYLKEHNYVTAIATSGEVAVKRAKLIKPNLILLDVMMTGIDGFETCRRLKNEPETKDTPVIFMTALTDDVNMARGFAAGAVDYITKPLKKEELLARVNTHVEIQRYRNHLEVEVRKRTATLQERTEELNVMNQRLHSIMASVPEPLVIYNTDLTVTYVNPAFTRVFGWTLPELEGKKIPYIPEGNRSETDIVIRKTFEANYHLDFETVRYSKDGDMIDVVISLATISDSDGNVTGLVVNLRDVTERKNLEEQLQKVQKLEAIGTLAGGIAHDFNNILSPILGYAELMMMDAEQGSVLEKRLKGVNDAALRARDLVQQILSSSRQVVKEDYPLRLQPVIKETLKLLRASLPTTIEIRQSINARCRHVKADPTKIHQIIMNLGTNAFHAMEQAGGVFSVSLEERHMTSEAFSGRDFSPGPYACIRISDTGIGMDEDTRKRIFEAYYTTKENGKGTGLGLSVVHGIVMSCGGNIVVDSVQGKGTEFSVFLPVVDDTGMVIPAEPEGVITGTERVLVVDDEVSLLQMHQLILERLGYQVVTEDSSVRALQLFMDAPDSFDLIITDMTMPQKTGEQLAMEIKAIRKDIPVILCTGYSERISEKTFPDTAIDHVLMKPVTLNSISKTVRKLLDKDLK